MNKKVLIITTVILAIIIPVLLFGFTDGPKKYHKFYDRTWLGISTTELTPQLREYFGVEEELGILVSEVAEESPAERSGLKAGDVITEADGESIYSARDLAEIIREYDPGDELEIEIVRNRQEEKVHVELGQNRKSISHHFGYNPHKIEVFIPEMDIDIPEIRLPDFDEEEIERLQESIKEEMKFNQKEMREQLEKIREKMKDIRIETRYETEETI